MTLFLNSSFVFHNVANDATNNVITTTTGLIFEIRKEGDYKRLLFQGSPVGIRYRIVRRVNPRTILVGKDKYSLSCYYCKDDKLMYFPTSRLKIYPMYLIVKYAYIIYRTSFNKLYDTNISYIKYFDKSKCVKI